MGVPVEVTERRLGLVNRFRIALQNLFIESPGRNDHIDIRRERWSNTAIAHPPTSTYNIVAFGTDDTLRTGTVPPSVSKEFQTLL